MSRSPDRPQLLHKNIESPEVRRPGISDYAPWPSEPYTVGHGPWTDISLGSWQPVAWRWRRRPGPSSCAPLSAPLRPLGSFTRAEPGADRTPHEGDHL